ELEGNQVERDVDSLVRAGLAALVAVFAECLGHNRTTILDANRVVRADLDTACARETAAHGALVVVDLSRHIALLPHSSTQRRRTQAPSPLGMALRVSILSFLLV